MYGCCPPTIPPPNEKAQKYVNYLRICMYLELIIGIMKFFTSNFFSGFYDLIVALIIYQTYAQLSYFNVMFLLFFNTMNLARAIAMVGTVIQDHYPAFANSYIFYDAYEATVNYISLALYIFIAVLSFYVYREFKALSFEMSGAGIGGGGGQYVGGGGGSYGGQGDNDSYVSKKFFNDTVF